MNKNYPIKSGIISFAVSMSLCYLLAFASSSGIETARYQHAKYKVKAQTATFLDILTISEYKTGQVYMFFGSSLLSFAIGAGAVTNAKRKAGNE